MKSTKNKRTSLLSRARRAVLGGPRVRTIADSHIPDENTGEYYSAQIERSMAKISKDAAFRYEFFGDFLKSRNLLAGVDDLLCVGCRNVFELEYFAALGIKNVSGIDLFSVDPRIKVMDMHRMEFADASFDALYAGDCFEHSKDPCQVASEFIRVVKPGGLIMLSIPMNHRTDEVDRVPFFSKEDLYQYFQGTKMEILLENLKKGPEEKIIGLSVGFKTGGR